MVSLRRLSLLALGLGLAAFLAYRSSFAGAFVLDDHREIERNASLRRLWPVTEVFGAIRSRPVVALSLAVNHAMGGLDPRGYHAVNLAIHVLAALVLFGLVRRTLAGARLGSRYGTAAVPLAFTVALLWTVHPLQTSSVTYVIQRAELLMALFFLTTLYALARIETASRPGAWQLLAVASCVAGMGSKQVMATAPIVALLYDRAFLARSFGEALRVRRYLYGGLAATWALVAAFGTALLTSHRLLFSTGRFHTGEYVLSQPGVILYYLRLAFWPHPLCFDYDDWPVARAAADWLPSLLIVVMALVATGLGWRRRRHQPLAFLGAFFFLGLAPTSLIPTKDLLFEHRMYLPLAAVVTAVVIAAHEGAGWLERRLAVPRLRTTMGRLLAGSVGLALGVMTTLRNDDYGSEMRLWEDTLAKRRSSVRAMVNLGTQLANRARLQEAEELFDRALALNPNQLESHYNRGRILFDRGALDEALAEFRTALRILPTFAPAHEAMAEVLARLGQAEAATAHLREAGRVKELTKDQHR